MEKDKARNSENWTFQNKPISYIISLSSNELNSHKKKQVPI